LILFLKLTPNFLGQHPNTYTFTKSLAENLILEKARDLPIAIVRPSMSK
jgi:fatty acyl-CoA reductase